MDPLSAVVDEVALEGLDGITIPSLWIRLIDRQPTFPLKNDDCTKELIWKSLVNNSDLKFYELPQERDDVVLTDRFENIDPETGIETAREQSTKKDIYPIHVIPENKDGVQGSCAFFKERKEITKVIRSKSFTPLVNLEETLQRYGRKLVVVASQNLRFRTLIGSESDPDLKLSDESFCLLERVGRARWQGELQSELHGHSFKSDARRLHYVRKALVKHGLISMQSHVMRHVSGQQQHSILLLLNRFHVNRRSKYDLLMEQVSHILEQLPNQFVSVLAIKQRLNLSESTSKRLFGYLRVAKFAEFCQVPLEEIEPTAKRLVSKKGNALRVRCLKLLKPYSKKSVPEQDDDDDEEEEDYSATGKRAFPSEGRVMERDVLSQAYHCVAACGTKGIPQSDIGYRMNVGKLEARMFCRRLERDGLIKGFMVDEGRQRTTKFITHKCVGLSDQLQLFVKEQELNKQLTSSAPQKSETTAVNPRAAQAGKVKNKGPPAQKSQNLSGPGPGPGAGPGHGKGRGSGRGKGRGSCRGRGRGKGRGRKSKDDKAALLPCGDQEVKMEDGVLEEEREKSAEETGSVTQTQLGTQDGQLTVAESGAPPCSQTQSRSTALTANEVNERSDRTPPGPSTPMSPSVATNNREQEINIVVLREELQQKGTRRSKCNDSEMRSHETYRLLRRKNLIVEAIRNSKIMEGYYPLQKMINAREKQDGVNSKCCKKTIVRLVHSLSREGLLKMYTTTIIQDGITKQVDMIVHPSVQPNDDIVHRLIEQIRFKISSSYTVLRKQQAEENRRQQLKGNDEVGRLSKGGEKSKTGKKERSKTDDFKPIPERGFGKSWGYQPKMHRLRVTHSFLWYLIYGHPNKLECSDTDADSEPLTHLHSCDDVVKTPGHGEVQDPRSPDVTTLVCETAESNGSKTDLNTTDAEEGTQEDPATGPPQPGVKVNNNEESWKSFIPPVRVRKGYGSGWAMLADVLLCLPLSVFVQVIQITYKVEGLGEYLNDPVKQHFLIRVLPSRLRRQLLYKRKYLFSFYENLQKLVYMGLLQFGPVEKFKEKDQVFICLRRNASIIDTTSSEPHYWLVTESEDKPFETRRYTFNTSDDVENYWFDLMCVCLNTPLGVIRSKRKYSDHDSAPSFVPDRHVFVGLAYLLKGSREVCDDGAIPGDHRGAGGLHSEFFAHLKRNWLWTSHLLSNKASQYSARMKEEKVRLKSLLSKNALRFAFTAGASTTPRCVTSKLSLATENIQVRVETASRNKQVVGGKKQKRKRSKKEVVLVPRKKKKEPRKRPPAHDEVDHQALKMMTRQRVYWTIQEDSMLMLCSVATRLINSKLKRPFVPYCIVRDLLHAEFEMSNDKTSVAVGRRTRYILKNPQTLLNYRVCLAEVYQDKDLLRQLDENKPQDPNKAEDCATAFSAYAKLLRQKFSSVIGSCDVIIPDTKRELFSRFKVSAIECKKLVLGSDVINSTEDIHTIVLHNLIQSTLAMTNSQMQLCRSFQTFHMYSKYNQDLLCHVFLECRHRGLVNRRRINMPNGPKKNRGLPILPMSYQMSQSYYKCFTWRFPRSLCSDSFRLLKNLMDIGKGDTQPVLTFYNETEKRSASGEEEVRRPKNKQQREENVDGAAARDPDVRPEEAAAAAKRREEGDVDVDGEVDKDEGGHRRKMDENQTETVSREGLSGEDKDSKTEEAFSQNLPDLLDMMLRFPTEAPGGFCMAAVSLMSVGLLNVYLSIPKQMVVVDSNLVDKDLVKSMTLLEDDEDEDDDNGEECEGQKKPEINAQQASHTKYLMMKGYCCPGIVKIRNLNTSDNIVVESCNIRLQLRKTAAHRLFTVENSAPLDLTKCGPSLLPSSLTCSVSLSSPPQSVEESVEQKGYTPQDTEACAQIRRSLDEAAQRGLSVGELYQSHAHLEQPQCGRSRSLEQYLKDLQEVRQVLKVGALGIRYVLVQHAEPWLLSVGSKSSSKPRFSPDGLPFLVKKRRRENLQKTEEPPFKRAATEVDKGPDGLKVPEKSGDVPGKEGMEKDKYLNQEEKNKKEGESGQEKRTRQEETEHEEVGEILAGHRGRRQRTRTRKTSDVDEAESPPAGSFDMDDDVSFISRPWRLVDGKLNKMVCKGMMEAVLYHIMSQPGVTQQSLMEHYRNVLQPVALLDLVEALIEMGCVTRRTLVKTPRPSLFGRGVTQNRLVDTQMVEDPETVFYEPTISCCLQLCRALPNERCWNEFVP